MNKRHANNLQDHFDLFPYIGLLVCFLGALLLTTLGIASLSIGPSMGETWQLASVGGNQLKAPVLVEWDGKEAIVHAGDERRRLEGMRAAGGGAREEISPAVRELITEFGRAGATQYPLFAVRPSGFASFRVVAMAFRQAKVDIGYEPIGQDRPVRLGPPRAQP